MSQPEEKSKFDRSGKARTNERKYPYIVELSVPLTGLDIQISRQITTFHKSRHIQVRYGRIRMVKIITAGVSRIYRSLALSSSSLAESYAKGLEYNGVAVRRNVRLWHKANITRVSSDVRFTPDSVAKLSLRLSLARDSVV